MAEFDAVAGSYTKQHIHSIKLSGESVEYFARYKIEDARRWAEKRGVKVRRILDFGSGIGNSLQPMREQFPDAEIICLDVSEESLELSRSTRHDGVDYRNYDGRNLPGNLGSFDLIFTACVFHHIPQDAHILLLRQLRERLSPSGFFILFEHNPWNPLTLHAVNNCPFDENAVLISAPEMRRRFKLAGFTKTHINFRVFFPGPLAALRILESALVRLPIGAQYFIAAT